MIKLAIDASNIRSGGGLRHLQAALEAAEPARHGFSSVVVWAGGPALQALPERPWLRKRSSPFLERSLPLRAFWQQALLPGILRREGFDVLFCPGGTIPLAGGVPAVTMSQNLLPFSPGELDRMPLSSGLRLKMRLLRWVQAASFKRASGVIFLSRFAERLVRRSVRIPGKTVIIPHGADESLLRLQAPRVHSDGFFELLYVSPVERYKNHDLVLDAVSRLRQGGCPARLAMAGGGDPALTRHLRRRIEREPLLRGAALLLGALPRAELAQAYARAHAFVFASSCENFPMTLLEALSAGLPVCAVEEGPMPEIMGSAGLYFQAGDTAALACRLRELYADAGLRARLSREARRRALAFSWASAAERTFGFIAAAAAPAGA